MRTGLTDFGEYKDCLEDFFNRFLDNPGMFTLEYVKDIKANYYDVFVDLIGCYPEIQEEITGYLTYSQGILDLILAEYDYRVGWRLRRLNMPRQHETEIIVISYCDFWVIVYKVGVGMAKVLESVCTNKLKELMTKWKCLTHNVDHEQLYFNAVKLEFHEYLNYREVMGYSNLTRIWFLPSNLLSEYIDTSITLFILMTLNEGTPEITTEWDKPFNDILLDPNEGQGVIY